VSKHITQIGRREAEFLAEMSSLGGKFTIMEAKTFWKENELAARKLYELQKRGWLERIERGKYLIIPFEAGIHREWSEDPYLIASMIAEPAAIAYWSAIRHWNWTEQIPRIVYVQTTSRKKLRRRVIFGVLYEFVRIQETQFFGHVRLWIKGKPVLVTDMEKTLLDCANDVDRAGTIEELSKAVKAAAPHISWTKLGEYAERMNNRSVRKRLGFLFETLNVPLTQDALSLLDRWQSSLSEGYVLLQPGAGNSGKFRRRWKIKENVVAE
jgi:predicted transcriptional regulator of viral defense system